MEIALGLPLPDSHALRTSNRRLDVRMRPSGGVALFLAARAPVPRDAKTTYARHKLDSLVTQVEWTPISPLRSRFVNGTHIVFNLLQVVAAASAREARMPVDNATDSPATLPYEARVHISRQYRLHLEQHLQHLKGGAQTLGTNEAHQELELARNVQAIWHLTDLVFVSAASGDPFPDAFVTWLNVSYPLAEPAERGTDRSTQWQAFQRRLVRGDTALADQLLLRLDDGSAPAAFATARTLVKGLPRRTQFAVKSEYQAAWVAWQQSCRAAVRTLGQGARSAAAVEPLLLAVRLLGGDADALASLSASLQLPWHDILAATLIYIDPTAQSYEIASHVDDAMRGKTLSQSDRVMRALLELDTTQAISLCSSIDLWLTAHLTDFLFHCGQLDTLLADERGAAPPDLREHFLLEYGAALLTHPTHWQVGVAYLRACPVAGLATLEALLERVPVTTEAQLDALLAICQDCKLDALSQALHRVRARQSLEHGRHGAAIYHLLQAGDDALVVRLADQLLDQYLAGGTLTYRDIVELLGQHAQHSERLAFLRLYFDFHELYKAGDYRAASGLLVRALSTQLAPKRFWPALLFDAVPLLEAPDMYFGADDTFELMRCLEDLLASAADPKLLNGRSPSDFEPVHLALARNLARAVLAE